MKIINRNTLRSQYSVSCVVKNDVFLKMNIEILSGIHGSIILYINDYLYEKNKN